jgi:hypothetical protein
VADLWEGFPEPGEVKRLTLGPHDRLAICYPGKLSEEQGRRLKDRLAVLLPDVPVLVFDSGAELRVVAGE